MKAQVRHTGKKNDRATIRKAARIIRSEFDTDRLSFISFVLEGVLQQSGLNSDIVQGIAASDPLIMFNRPTEVALRYFNLLYGIFQLKTCNENLQNYLELLEFLQTSYSGKFDIDSVARDLIEYLMELEFLQAQFHLFQLFKFCCFCITETSRQFPSGTLGRNDTTGIRDVLLMSLYFVKVSLPERPVQFLSAAETQIIPRSLC